MMNLHMPAPEPLADRLARCLTRLARVTLTSDGGGWTFQCEARLARAIHRIL